MLRNILKFGIFSGVIVATLMVVTQLVTQFNMAYGELVGYSTMVAAFSMIFVGIKKFRDSRTDKKATFLQSLLIGLGISLIATIFYAATWGFIDGFSGGEFLDQYASAQLTELKENGATAEEIKATEAQIDYYRELYKNPITKMLITAVEILPVGIIVSLISALIFYIRDKRQ